MVALHNDDGQRSSLGADGLRGRYALTIFEKMLMSKTRTCQSSSRKCEVHQEATWMLAHMKCTSFQSKKCTLKEYTDCVRHLIWEIWLLIYVTALFDSLNVLYFEILKNNAIYVE